MHSDQNMQYHQDCHPHDQQDNQFICQAYDDFVCEGCPPRQAGPLSAHSCRATGNHRKSYHNPINYHLQHHNDADHHQPHQGALETVWGGEVAVGCSAPGGLPQVSSSSS